MLLESSMYSTSNFGIMDLEACDLDLVGIQSNTHLVVSYATKFSSSRSFSELGEMPYYNRELHLTIFSFGSDKVYLPWSITCNGRAEGHG